MIKSLEQKKQRYPREFAQKVGAELQNHLEPYCERIAIVGSLRRGRPSVGDLELLYVGKGAPPESLWVNEADQAIDALIRINVLERRRTFKGHYAAYGKWVKLLRHCETGLPVDLFSTTMENWFNVLVCRTGPAEGNILISLEARKKGWKWNPFASGFTRLDDGDKFDAASEEDVFKFVGLPYKEPRDR